MASGQTTLSANGDTQIGSFQYSRRDEHLKFTIASYGDFGGGTLGVKASYDGGTTKIALREGGSAYSVTDDDVLNLSLQGSNSQEVILYASLTGSTSPDITVDFFSPQ